MKKNHKCTVSLFNYVVHRRTASLGSADPKAVRAVLLQLSSEFKRGILPQCPKLIPPSSSSRSHGKHAQGAGLVLQTQDAVGDSFQMARQPHPDVLNIPARQRAVEKQMRS